MLILAGGKEHYVIICCVSIDDVTPRQSDGSDSETETRTDKEEAPAIKGRNDSELSPSPEPHMLREREGGRLSVSAPVDEVAPAIKTASEPELSPASKPSSLHPQSEREGEKTSLHVSDDGLQPSLSASTSKYSSPDSQTTSLSLTPSPTLQPLTHSQKQEEKQKPSLTTPPLTPAGDTTRADLSSSHSSHHSSLSERRGFALSPIRMGSLTASGSFLSTKHVQSPSGKRGDQVRSPSPSPSSRELVGLEDVQRRPAKSVPSREGGRDRPGSREKGERDGGRHGHVEGRESWSSGDLVPLIPSVESRTLASSSSREIRVETELRSTDQPVHLPLPLVDTDKLSAPDDTKSAQASKLQVERAETDASVKARPSSKSPTSSKITIHMPTTEHHFTSGRDEEKDEVCEGGLLPQSNTVDTLVGSDGGRGESVREGVVGSDGGGREGRKMLGEGEEALREAGSGLEGELSELQRKGAVSRGGGVKEGSGRQSEGEEALREAGSGLEGELSELQRKGAVSRGGGVKEGSGRQSEEEEALREAGSGLEGELSELQRALEAAGLPGIEVEGRSESGDDEDIETETIPVSSSRNQPKPWQHQSGVKGHLSDAARVISISTTSASKVPHFKPLGTKRYAGLTSERSLVGGREGEKVGSVVKGSNSVLESTIRALAAQELTSITRELLLVQSKGGGGGASERGQRREDVAQVCAEEEEHGERSEVGATTSGGDVTVRIEEHAVRDGRQRETDGSAAAHRPSLDMVRKRATQVQVKGRSLPHTSVKSQADGGKGQRHMASTKTGLTGIRTGPVARKTGSKPSLSGSRTSVLSSKSSELPVRSHSASGKPALSRNHRTAVGSVREDPSGVGDGGGRGGRRGGRGGTRGGRGGGGRGGVEEERGREIEILRSEMDTWKEALEAEKVHVYIPQCVCTMSYIQDYTCIASLIFPQARVLSLQCEVEERDHRHREREAVLESSCHQRLEEIAALNRKVHGHVC